MTESTLRDRIFAEIRKLQDPKAATLYPYQVEDGEAYPQCHFCDEVGLFHSGNGGIPHTSECVITLAYRVLVEREHYGWFDRLAYKSILHQIANMERWPRKPAAGHMDWQYFCPFCQCLMHISREYKDGTAITHWTMPHTVDCIVTLAKSELEQQQGGKK